MEHRISLPTKEQVSGIINTLEHKTEGLAAISASVKKNNNDINSVNSKLTDPDSGLDALKLLIDEGASQDSLDTIRSILENTTYGLNAIRKFLDSTASELTVDNIYDSINSEIYGLKVLKNLIKSINEDGSSTNETIIELNTYVKNSHFSLERIFTDLRSVYLNTCGYPNATVGTLRSTTAAGSAILNVTGRGKLTILSCDTPNVNHTFSVDSCPETNFYPISTTNIATTSFTFENSLKFYIPNSGVAVLTKYLLQTA